MEYIPLNPTPVERPKSAIVSWVRQRDRQLLFPIIVNEELVEFKNLGSVYKSPCDVHHITPIYFLRRFYPMTDPNHTLNLITLPRELHARIHKEWIDRYENVPEATSSGKPAWVDKFDEHFTAMAIVNSYDYLMEHEELPFHEEQEQEIYSAYQLLDPEWLDMYRFAKSL